MRLQIKLAVTIGLAGWLFAAPASAADSPAKPQNRADEKVCENITMVGSRLAVKRVCATRFEWAEKRRRDRDMVDAAQRSPCVLAATDATGRPSC